QPCMVTRRSVFLAILCGLFVVLAISDMPAEEPVVCLGATENALFCVFTSYLSLSSQISKPITERFKARAYLRLHESLTFQLKARSFATFTSSLSSEFVRKLIDGYRQFECLGRTAC